jgi:pimeloyl-ACP methyl ester carboxylesterase
MYVPRIASRSEFVPIRGLIHHFRHWGDPGAPLLLVLHGWMDVSASFQFLADELADRWHVVGPDWRGFGLTGPAGTDCYEFTDYIGDLDAFLRHLSPNAPMAVLGHSMGGNAATTYAGIRPERISHLINLEGFGMPDIKPEDVPQRLRKWLGQIEVGERFADYDTLEAVAARLCKTNPRLDSDKAMFLAGHWAHLVGDRWQLLADPGHKIINRVAYRLDEVLACWRQIVAPVLWVEASHSEVKDRMYRLPGYADRLKAIGPLRRLLIDDASHMLHHDQPAAVAQRVADFLRSNAYPTAQSSTMAP